MTQNIEAFDPVREVHGNYGRPSEDEPWQVTEARKQVVFGLDAAAFLIQATADRIEEVTALQIECAADSPDQHSGAVEANQWATRARLELARLHALLAGERQAVLAGDAAHLASVAADQRRQEQQEEQIAAWLDDDDVDA